MPYNHRTIAAGLIACAGGMAALALPAASYADAIYTQEVARCNSGQSGQDRATCLREAGAAQQERTRNGLTPADPSATSDRCAALPADQRQDCMAQMSGQADTRVYGSVQGGGVLRETVIPVPAGSAAPAGYGSSMPPPAMPAPGYAPPAPGYAPPAPGYAPPPAGYAPPPPPGGYAPPPAYPPR